MAQDFIVRFHRLTISTTKINLFFFFFKNGKSGNEIKLTLHDRYLGNSTITARKERRKLESVQPLFETTLLKLCLNGVGVYGLI